MRRPVSHIQNSIRPLVIAPGTTLHGRKPRAMCTVKHGNSYWEGMFWDEVARLKLDVRLIQQLGRTAVYDVVSMPESLAEFFMSPCVENCQYIAPKHVSREHASLAPIRSGFHAGKGGHNKIF